jgi:hypothetical protein
LFTNYSACQIADSDAYGRMVYNSNKVL